MTTKPVSEAVSTERRITIDPITRLEGHGRIEIFLNPEGDVENAYFQVPELRGFEKFCEGRPVEDLAIITPRICGVCPEAHHIASAKALDAVFDVDPPPAAKKLRELLYSAFYVADHATHFYALGGPDFVVGPDASPAERNIIGVVHKVGLELGGEVLKHLELCHDVVAMIGGKYIHPVCGLPGGVSKPITEEERAKIEEIARSAVEFGKLSLKVFDDVVLANKGYVDLILSDAFTHKTYYMGLVDEKNKVNFYDGMLRVVDPEGKEFAKFAPVGVPGPHRRARGALDLPQVPVPEGAGLEGLRRRQGQRRVPGGAPGPPQRRRRHGHPARPGRATSGCTPPWAASRSTPRWPRTGRASSSSSTPPSACSSWPRDPEITSPNVRTIPTATPDEGVGIVEAPRGTLMHHYITDEKGLVRKVNLIVGTANNYAAICMSVRKAAQGLIKPGTVVTEGLLNRIEMAFRAYDPCFGCATHSLPGQMPLIVSIYDAQGKIVEQLRRD